MEGKANIFYILFSKRWQSFRLTIVYDWKVTWKMITFLNGTHSCEDACICVCVRGSD